MVTRTLRLIERERLTNPADESNGEVLRLDFDRRLMLQFRGPVVTSDAGLLAYRELDDTLGLSVMASEVLADARRGRHGHRALVGMLRQSVFGRFAGCEDVIDAERVRHDPAMRWIAGGKAAQKSAASPSSMGRFETVKTVVLISPEDMDNAGEKAVNYGHRGADALDRPFY